MKNIFNAKGKIIPNEPFSLDTEIDNIQINFEK